MSSFDDVRWVSIHEDNYSSNPDWDGEIHEDSDGKYGLVSREFLEALLEGARTSKAYFNSPWTVK